MRSTTNARDYLNAKAKETARALNEARMGKDAHAFGDVLGAWRKGTKSDLFLLDAITLAQEALAENYAPTI